jgi:hypothetical protein
MTSSLPIVKCGSCGGLLDEDASTPIENRRSCPECGSKTRALSITVSGAITMHSKIGMKARHAKKGRPFLEQIVGDDLHHKTGRWMKLQRVIDRAKNWYCEIVQDLDTGEVFHQSEEPLTEHRGHGAARTLKKD